MGISADVLTAAPCEAGIGRPGAGARRSLFGALSVPLRSTAVEPPPSEVQSSNPAVVVGSLFSCHGPDERAQKGAEIGYRGEPGTSQGGEEIGGWCPVPEDLSRASLVSADRLGMGGPDAAADIRRFSAR
jgi:hypothetical protein